MQDKVRTLKGNYTPEETLRDSEQCGEESTARKEHQNHQKRALNKKEHKERGKKTGKKHPSYSSSRENGNLDLPQRTRASSRGEPKRRKRRPIKIIEKPPIPWAAQPRPARTILRKQAHAERNTGIKSANALLIQPDSVTKDLAPTPCTRGRQKRERGKKREGILNRHVPLLTNPPP